MKQTAQQENRFQFAVDGDSPGRLIDILVDADAPQFSQGAGSLHHIAFRTPNAASQAGWRTILKPHVNVTSVVKCAKQAGSTASNSKDYTILFTPSA